MKITQKTLIAPLAALCALLAAAGTLPGHAAPPPAAGTDFQVNAATAGNQAYPAAAQDTAGNSVVVWIDFGTGTATLKARRFDALGAPAGGEIVITRSGSLTGPRVAMTPLGAFAVVWNEEQGVYLRRYDRLGGPQGGTARVTSLADLAALGVDVALDAAGQATVVWAIVSPGGEDLLLQRFDASNRPLGSVETVNTPSSRAVGPPRLARNAAGSLLVVWDDQRQAPPSSWARRFDGPTGTWGPETRVSSGNGTNGAGAPILYPEGDGAVVFLDYVAGTLNARRLDSRGVPLGGDITLSGPDPIGFDYPAAAAGPDGSTLVTWQAQDLTLRAAFFDGAWNRLGANFTLGSQPFDAQSQPAVAAGGPGNLLVAWAEGGPSFPFEPPVPPTGRDGSGLGIFAQRFQSPACAAGSDRLCLGDAGRFSVQVSWKNPYTGETGTGKSAPLTGDTGAFWFFDPANLELMIKVLDGRAVNGNFWVFYGSLSNVEYTVTVTDAVFGTMKTYHNAPFQLASQADVDAFPDTTGAPTPPAAPRRATAATAATSAEASCTPDPATLCPQSRFQVAVSFTDPRTGIPAPGHAVTLSGDTGIFWFFDPANLELMVKVLDGTAINGSFWVFYGGLSDVEYTLTVTDTVTGKQRLYHNPPHHLASVADIDAF